MRLVCCAVGVLVSVGAFAQPSESDRLNAFFEEVFERWVDESPQFQSYLGIKKDYDKWDDLSDVAATEDLAETAEDLARMRRNFDFDALDDQAKMSYRLFEYSSEESIANYRWRFHNYPINQMFGYQTRIPAFMINIHRISDVSDAEAYIARLHGIGPMFDQIIEGIETRRTMGILPPRFVLELALENCHDVVTGKPFDKSRKDSSLLADFKAKVGALELDRAEEKALVTLAENALETSMKPAYEKLIVQVEAMLAEATDDDGAWKLPNGDGYYQQALRNMTTTDMTPDEIHALGLAEVARIHEEMKAIMKQVGFEGTLQEFFVFMRNDDQFYYPDTEAGRTRYLNEATALIDNMRNHLDELFITKPKAEITVKRVEAFREKSAGKAFYQSPAPDGSRPGIYYANLYDMREMPTYQMEALAYHEGIPGHHMQLSIAQELEDIPTFRKHDGHTAYTEGWGLYTELLPKEFGFYEDPYSDFGRLAMELWRAARLVVDTGLHHKRWPRQQAIDYLIENTPNAEGDCERSINRYIVMPGQACAYKIGMLKIVELREYARGELGDAFDIREYHDVILGQGSMPLAILDEYVKNWVASKKN